MRKLIGLAGKMGAGKTFMAQALRDALINNGTGLNVRIYAFATALKDAASKEFGYPVAWNYCAEGKSRVVGEINGKPATVREALQWYGDQRRSMDVNVFVKQTHQDIEQDQPDIAIVEDVRRLNEAQYILDNGGLLVRLDGKTSANTPQTTQHISETDLDDFKFDLVLKNSYTSCAAETNVRLILRHLWRM